MERYIAGLLEDIEVQILNQWNRQTPHYYEMGVDRNNPFLQPPKGWRSPKIDLNNEDEQSLFIENEQFTSGLFELNMFDIFELTNEQFPNLFSLTSDHLDRLTFYIQRLWEAHNYTAIIPTNVPSITTYSLLLAQMKKPIMPVRFGHISIEFCQYDPSECPFGESFCSCKELFLTLENEEANQHN